jgi:hypothetical protein
MSKKAVIIGISNYDRRAPNLQSPIREIQEWRDLLVEEYGFRYPDIRLLANERATRAEVETRFDWLFDGSGDNDERIFIFCGHGVRLRQRNGRTGELLDNLEEALLTYPGPNEDMEKFAIYDDDLMERYAKKRLPLGTNVTFIFDCCAAGGITLSDLPRDPVVMGAAPPADLDHRSRRESWSPSPPRRELRNLGFAIPVFVSAAGELNVAVEIDIGGVKRSNFSYHAIRALRENPAIHFDELRDTLRDSMRDYFPQFPNILGDEFRADKRFLKRGEMP